VVYSRVVMAQHGVSVGAAWAGKVKAVVQGSCSFLLVLTPLYQQYTGPWIIHLWSWIVAVVTAGSVIPYVTKAAAATLTSPPGPPAA
jgi:phosphatidylglycerophosphate synthase